MKKFKKPLVINVPQDDHHQISSPTHITYKQNNQRPLLMYNQHTIASSINNQDQLIEEDDRQLATCQEFAQFQGKSTFQTKKFDKNQIQQPGIKSQKHKKFNVIQFQEFSVDGDKSKTVQTSYSSTQGIQKKQNKNKKRQFSIQIPQNEEKQQKNQLTNRFAFDIKNDALNKGVKQNNFMKQPPAPSNKAKITKTLNRHFVFPTNDEQIYINNENKKQQIIEKVITKVVSQQQHDKKIKQINQEWSQKIDLINKSFQKQRQQFYKQKSSLQKDLMIKDGQIQMLQKLITNRYSPKQSNNSNYNHQQQQFVPVDKFVDKQDTYKANYLQGNKLKSSLYVSDQKINSMETILLQKDLQINSLLQKINDLNNILQKKNTQLEQIKINLIKNQKMNQSLRNEVFIYEKKEQSQKLTKNFYKMKQTLIQVQQSSKTPKGYSRNKWNEDIQIQKQKNKSPQRQQYPLRGIDDLHKRLQSLKMNRIQLENRGRIKSQLNYPQTSKNKTTKTTFDFKGKFYDRDRDYINQSRMY